MLIVLTMLVHFSFAKKYTTPLVVTLNHGGQVRGYLENNVTKFLGIPYAKPPIGLLRFKPPEPVTPWQGIKDATRLPNACVQNVDTYFGEDFEGSKIWNPNTNISEDCLYLNVWAPATRNRFPKETVMVWIYGGGYYSGSSALSVYDGSYLAEVGITVVSMNYRVSLFGFLYLGIPEAPGNMGLEDQNLALRWVRDNIAKFGADPDRVTIFGESAGAACVELQTLSPKGKNLFKNAIMQSGTAIANWATVKPDEALKRSLKFSKSVNCWTGKGNLDKKKILTCLKKSSAQELIKNEYVVTDFIPLTFVPVIDGDFLPEDPEKMLKAGKGNPVNVIYGTNRDEGNYLIVYYATEIYKRESFFKTSDFINSVSDFKKAAMLLMPKRYKHSEKAVEKILLEYGVSKPDLTAKQRQNYLDKMVGDYHFTCPILQAALHRANQGQNVYVYYMTHRTWNMPWPYWMGVLHGYEIQYVFGEPLREKSKYESDEKYLSCQFINDFGSFARDGDPNRGKYKWYKFTNETQKYLVFGTKETHGLATRQALRREQCQLWNDLASKKIDKA